MATSKSHIDGVEWATALMALIKLAPKLQQEVDGLNMQFKDAYSLMAWRSVCHHLRAVAHGMTVMQLLAEGKSHAQITEATGIQSLSISAYKGWNTMYARHCGLDELVEQTSAIASILKVIREKGQQNRDRWNAQSSLPRAR
jgi:uncharacterized protein YerC